MGLERNVLRNELYLRGTNVRDNGSVNVDLDCFHEPWDETNDLVKGRSYDEANERPNHGIKYNVQT